MFELSLQHTVILQLIPLYSYTWYEYVWIHGNQSCKIIQAAQVGFRLPSVFHCELRVPEVIIWELPKRHLTAGVGHLTQSCWVMSWNCGNCTVNWVVFVELEWPWMASWKSIRNLYPTRTKLQLSFCERELQFRLQTVLPAINQLLFAWIDTTLDPSVFCGSLLHCFSQQTGQLQAAIGWCEVPSRLLLPLHALPPRSWVSRPDDPGVFAHCMARWMTLGP